MTEVRKLSAILVLGVLAFPAIFVWFLLRSGYSSDVRTGGFLCLGVGILSAVSANL